MSSLSTLSGVKHLLDSMIESAPVFTYPNGYPTKAVPTASCLSISALLGEMAKAATARGQEPGCCECGEPYPAEDLGRGEIYCRSCRRVRGGAPARGRIGEEGKWLNRLRQNPGQATSAEITALITLYEDFARLYFDQLEAAMPRDDGEPLDKTWLLTQGLVLDGTNDPNGWDALVSKCGTYRVLPLPHDGVVGWYANLGDTREAFPKTLMTRGDFRRLRAAWVGPPSP